ncbi:MAG: hypothetical protein KatS3mg111_0317 [Pirellulaceae bacterium]|nr:MAG: hypothetical protein KatS3mg111_0317 [Pirellulaceae bacterium]
MEMLRASIPVIRMMSPAADMRLRPIARILSSLTGWIDDVWGASKIDWSAGKAAVYRHVAVLPIILTPQVARTRLQRLTYWL